MSESQFAQVMNIELDQIIKVEFLFLPYCSLLTAVLVWKKEILSKTRPQDGGVEANP